MSLQELATRVPAAGFALGAIGMGISTQLNYSLVPYACTLNAPLVVPVALALAVLALAGTSLSAVAWRADREERSPDAPEAGVPHKLLAEIGVLGGALFTLVILMQGVANLFLTGCE